MNEIDIKKLRKELGVTQKELAEMCGVTTRMVQYWEAGKTIPDSKLKLLRLLELRYNGSSVEQKHDEEIKRITFVEHDNELNINNDKAFNIVLKEISEIKKLITELVLINKELSNKVFDK